MKLGVLKIDRAENNYSERGHPNPEIQTPQDLSHMHIRALKFQICVNFITHKSQEIRKALWEIFREEGDRLTERPTSGQHSQTKKILNS